MSACEICLELFDPDEHVPRILPCGHSLCEQCLKFLKIYDESGDLSRNNPLCPKCRAEITVPKLSHLSKNFSLIEGSAKKKAIYCPSHEDLGLEAILYCLKCRVYVCAKCIATSHNAHEFEDLDKRVKKVKQLVGEMTVATGEQQRKQEKILDTYAKKREVIGKSQDEEKLAIVSHFQKFISKIEGERDAFVNTLERLYKKDIDELESMMELARRRIGLVQKVVSQVRTFETKLDAMSDSEILQIEATHTELNDLKIAASNINFQFVPEHQMHKYKFEGRDVVFPTSDMGVISKELLDEYILVLGDNNEPGNPTAGTWMLTVASQSWEQIPMEVTLRSYSAACFVPDFQAVVITGGKERTCVRTTQILDPMMKKSDTRSPMSTARDGHSCLYYEGTIYVIGGFNEEVGSLDSCEAYDLVTDQWTSRRSMTTKRSMFGACLCTHEVFVFGGHHKGYLNTVEKYTFDSDAWQRLSVILPYSAAGISASWYRDKIYLLGGCQSNATFSNVYTLDPNLLEMRSGGDMREKRAFAKVFTLGTKMLVLGGGKNFTAEVFNGEQWSQFESEGEPKSNLEKFTGVFLA